MAITTYADFVSNLAELSVSGVTRQYDYPPASLNAADLPASFVLLPSGDDAAVTFQAGGGWPTLRADLVVALAAVGQDVQEQNYDDAVAMMDSLAAALRDADLARSPLSWTLTTEVLMIAGKAFWCVRAVVEGRG